MDGHGLAVRLGDGGDLLELCQTGGLDDIRLQHVDLPFGDQRLKLARREVRFPGRDGDGQRIGHLRQSGVVLLAYGALEDGDAESLQAVADLDGMVRRIGAVDVHQQPHVIAGALADGDHRLDGAVAAVVEQGTDATRGSFDAGAVRQVGLNVPSAYFWWFLPRQNGGEDIFDPMLPPRTGQYQQYHSGAINALHLSYYRRRDDEPLNTCNLRKSHGFHLVAQAADPIPAVEYARPPYHLRLVKRGPAVRFWINALPVLSWDDDGGYGPPAGAGKIGLRQMSPIVGRYANLRAYEVR